MRSVHSCVSSCDPDFRSGSCELTPSIITDSQRQVTPSDKVGVQDLTQLCPEHPDGFRTVRTLSGYRLRFDNQLAAAPVVGKKPGVDTSRYLRSGLIGAVPLPLSEDVGAENNYVAGNSQDGQIHRFIREHKSNLFAGGDEHNRDLSIRRAQSVVTSLSNNQVIATRFTIMGYGEAQPVADNGTADGRRLNRRVDIAIFANDKLKGVAKTEG